MLISWFISEESSRAFMALTGGRYVVYIPYATAESTGLPLKPEALSMPLIMDPGTHIIVDPPQSAMPSR